MGDFSEALGHAESAELERKVAQVRRERDQARQALRQAEEELAGLRRTVRLISSFEDANPQPPKWLTPKKAKAGNRATVCTVLSDSHFDEVVSPDEVGGVNAYNREIATLRLRRYFERLVSLSRDHLAGVDYDGAVCCLGGDLFSGDIHEELSETNEDTILGSVLYWVEHVAAGLDMLAGEFGRLHVPVVVGNHGRRTRKPRAKLRARDNFDWFIGKLLAREFKADGRVTFDVPDAADCRFDVYGTTHLLTHGDQFRGGNGIAGIFSPVMRGHSQKTRRQQSIDQPYDLLVMGHWHQLITATGAGVLVNGSSKGYDEYAYVSNFPYEPPQQAMWLVTPERGVTFTAPVFVQDRKKEGW